MQVKRYEVFDMQEALERIKKDLGPDAVILSTRKINRGSGFGMFSRPMLEVTAAVDQAEEAATAKPAASKPAARPTPAPKAAPGYDQRGRQVQRPATTDGAEDADIQRLLSVFKEAAENTSARATPKSTPATRTAEVTEPTPALEHLAQEIRQVRQLLGENGPLGQIQRQQDQIEELRTILRRVASEKYNDSPVVPEKNYQLLYQRLRRAGIDHYICHKIVETLHSKLGTHAAAEQLDRHLRKLIGAMVPMSGPIRADGVNPKIVALVGPTGVGKTTTIAKIAASHMLAEDTSVGLITLDTYRIAAVEQLKTYAEIINVPVEVVNRNDSLLLALRRNLDRDLVLLDTAGRSHNDTRQIEELVQFLREDSEKVQVEVHLVLSAATKEPDLDDIINRFSMVGIDHVIVTKLDESRDYGGIFNVLARKGLGISYFTNGQDVPHDLVQTSGESFYRLMLESGENSHV